MKALFAFCLLCTFAYGDPPAVRPTGGPWGEPRSYRKIYESPRVIAQANVLNSDERWGPMGDPGVQIQFATATSSLLMNLGPRWFIADRDYLFTRGEVLPMFGLKIQLDDKTPAAKELPPREEAVKRVPTGLRWAPAGFDRR